MAAPHRWQRRKEARPGEILDAALELFVERGFAATRLDQVARRAGVSKGTLYLYYRSKEDLFRSVVKELVLPELKRVEKEVRAHRGSAATLLRLLGDHWYQSVGRGRFCGIPKLVIAESSNFPELAQFFVRNVVLRLRRIFAFVIRRGMRTGEFHAVPVENTARALIAPLVYAAVWQQSLAKYDTPFHIDKYLNVHLDMCLNGLSRRRQSKKRAK